MKNIRGVLVITVCLLTATLLAVVIYHYTQDSRRTDPRIEMEAQPAAPSTRYAAVSL